MTKADGPLPSPSAFQRSFEKEASRVRTVLVRVLSCLPTFFVFAYLGYKGFGFWEIVMIAVLMMLDRVLSLLIYEIMRTSV